MAYKNPIDQFVHEVGGTVKLAKALGAPPSTVSAWRTRGTIPSWRRTAIIDFAVREGKALPPELTAR